MSKCLPELPEGHVNNDSFIEYFLDDIMHWHPNEPKGSRVTGPKKVIIAGAPGTGKSSLVSLLGQHKDIRAYEEIPRKIINTYRQTRPHSMPWEDRESFDRLIFNFYKEDYEELTIEKVHILDGGMPDIIAWDIFLKVWPLPEARKYLNFHPYHHTVFMTSPLETIYVQDHDRPWDFGLTVMIDKCLRKTYKVLNYDIIDLPPPSDNPNDHDKVRRSLIARQNCILDHLDFDLIPDI